MRKFALICAMALGLASLSPGSTVHAQDDEPSVAERVEALSAEGAEHFSNGEYEAAIEKFEEAYELEPVPNLLFNIGRCYEQLEEWEEAQHYYEQFIRSPDVESQARDQAMDRVESLREIREVEDQEETDDQAVAEKEDEEQDDDTDQKDDDPEDVEEIEEPSMVPGFLAAGAGVGMIGAGVLSGLAASGNANRLDDTELSYDERLDAQSSARTQGIVADALYVGGAAALVTGGVLLYSANTAGGETGESTAYRATPWFDGDSAGFGVHLEF